MKTPTEFQEPVDLADSWRRAFCPKTSRDFVDAVNGWSEDMEFTLSLEGRLRRFGTPAHMILGTVAIFEGEWLRRKNAEALATMPTDGRGWSDSEWWTIQHAGDVSGVSRRTITRWVKSGRVRKWIIGTKNVRVRAEDVLRTSGQGCPIMSHRRAWVQR